MSDGTGILQHALFNVPNFLEGYCTDDNARAYHALRPPGELGGQPPSESLDRLATELPGFPGRRPGPPGPAGSAIS